MHWGVFAISAAHLYQNYLEEALFVKYSFQTATVRSLLTRQQSSNFIIKYAKVVIFYQLFKISYRKKMLRYNKFG